MFSNSKYIILTAIISTLLSCSKGKDGSPDNPTDPDTYKIQTVTMVEFSIPNSSGNPTGIGFKNSTTSLGVYSSNTSGEYRFEFHGKNGRQMLNGDPRNPGTETAIWSINAGDTVKAYKNGVLYRDFVTAVEDNINDGITWDYTRGTPISNVQANANAFTAAGGGLPQMKFKFGL